MYLTEGNENKYQPAQETHEVLSSLRVPQEGREILNGNSIGLGKTTLACHGIDALAETEEVILSNSFIVGQAEAGSPPAALVPQPLGDIYLNFMAVPAVQPGEKILCLRLQPGVLEHYVEQGIVHDPRAILQVDPMPSADGRMGYPHTDPLSIFLKTKPEINGCKYFCATFPLAETSRKISNLGLEAFQNATAYSTNNKAAFREAAGRFGYPVLDGINLHREEDIQIAAERLSHLNKVWMKLAHGSGGDLVLPICAAPTVAALKRGLAVIRDSVKAAFQNSNFENYSLETYWPEEQLLPVGSTVLVEEDAGCRGKVLLNGSRTMLVAKNGSVTTTGYFRQSTGPAGDYRGSEQYDPRIDFGNEVAARLEQATSRVAHYCASEIQHYGFAGVDYFLIETASGVVEPYLVELNGRPTMSSIPAIVHSKLNNKFFMNINIWADRPLTVMRELTELFTLNGKSFTDRVSGEVFITPLAMRSLWTDGGTRLLIKSNAAKILVSGNSAEECHSVLSALERAGRVKFSES